MNIQGNLQQDYLLGFQHLSLSLILHGTILLPLMTALWTCSYLFDEFLPECVWLRWCCWWWCVCTVLVTADDDELLSTELALLSEEVDKRVSLARRRASIRTMIGEWIEPTATQTASVQDISWRHILYTALIWSAWNFALYSCWRVFVLL